MVKTIYHDNAWTGSGFTSTVSAASSSPNPTNGASGVGVTPTLTWLADSNATSHQVFFGYRSNAATAATANSAGYGGNFASAGFAPSAPPPGKIYLAPIGGQRRQKAWCDKG